MIELLSQYPNSLLDTTPINFLKMSRKEVEYNIVSICALSNVISRILLDKIEDENFLDQASRTLFHLSGGLPSINIQPVKVQFKNAVLYIDSGDTINAEIMNSEILLGAAAIRYIACNTSNSPKNLVLALRAAKSEFARYNILRVLRKLADSLLVRATLVKNSLLSILFGAFVTNYDEDLTILQLFDVIWKLLDNEDSVHEAIGFFTKIVIPVLDRIKWKT